MVERSRSSTPTATPPSRLTSRSSGAPTAWLRAPSRTGA